MRDDTQMKTLADSVKTISEPDDFSYAVRNFLDRFYRNPSVAMLEDEPELLVSQLDDVGLADAYVASVASWLCQKYDFPHPVWVGQSARIMKTPWFAAKTPNLKAILLQESPAAFRVRNLFVSANVLSRA